MRGLRRHRNRKQIKLVLGTAICLLMIMTVGYAAFSTNITINAKGYLFKRTTTSDLRSPKNFSNGELVEDSTIVGRYIYRGASPQNYICLDTNSSGSCNANDMYRILSVEPDGTLKVIKRAYITQTSAAWDLGYSSNVSGITSSGSTAGTRYSSTSTDYCYTSSASGYIGCKAWGSKTSTYNSTGTTNVTQMPMEAGSLTLKTLPTYDSYLNVYLNGGTYPTSSGTTSIAGWLVSQNSVITNNISTNHIFNIGPVAQESSQTLATDVAQESAYTWKGNVGVMSATDYVKANSNVSACGTVYLNISGAGADLSTCKTTNWIYDAFDTWVISPISNATENNVWELGNNGGIITRSPYNPSTIRPVFFLKSSVILSGDGTSSEPYRIA